MSLNVEGEKSVCNFHLICSESCSDPCFESKTSSPYRERAHVTRTESSPRSPIRPHHIWILTPPFNIVTRLIKVQPTCTFIKYVTAFSWHKVIKLTKPFPQLLLCIGPCFKYRPSRPRYRPISPFLPAFDTI